MRVFVDTKVLVSAFASRGISSDLLADLLEHDLVVGRNVLRELKKKKKLPVARTDEIVEFVAGQAADVIEGAQPVDAKVFCRPASNSVALNA